MSTQRRPERSYTLDDYFAIEEMGDAVRYEFYNGEIFALTGASFSHNHIVANLLSALRAAFINGPCDAFANDVRVSTPGGLYTYPDIVVFCGLIELADEKLKVATNPIVTVEVLSESTKNYDRGQKFDLLKSISTLREYVLIAQDQVYIEHFLLQETGEWERREYFKPDDALNLPSIDFQTKLFPIYRRVDFES